MARRAQRYPDDLPDPLASLNPRMTIGEIIAEPLRTYHPKMPVRKCAIASKR